MITKDKSVREAASVAGALGNQKAQKSPRPMMGKSSRVRESHAVLSVPVGRTVGLKRGVPNKYSRNGNISTVRSTEGIVNYLKEEIKAYTLDGHFDTVCEKTGDGWFYSVADIGLTYIAPSWSDMQAYIVAFVKEMDVYFQEKQKSFTTDGADKSWFIIELLHKLYDDSPDDFFDFFEPPMPPIFTGADEIKRGEMGDM